MRWRHRVATLLVSTIFAAVLMLAVGDDSGEMSLGIRVTIGVFVAAGVFFIGAPHFLTRSAWLEKSRGERPAEHAPTSARESDQGFSN